MVWAHHIVPWAVGGLTDLTNLTLLCTVCHGNVHERRWRLAREPDGRWRLHPRTANDRPADRQRAWTRPGCRRDRSKLE
ncbi:MAG: HNH endonuclease [Egibacteraceae bacterium]